MGMAKSLILHGHSDADISEKPGQRVWQSLGAGLPPALDKFPDHIVFPPAQAICIC